MISRFLSEKGVWIAAALAVAAAFCLYGFSVWFGALNQDEGWYLYASRMVANGSFPYRDFFFTQGPVLPTVYGSLHGLWGKAGVLGGRVLTAGLGILGALEAGILASRLVRRECRCTAGVVAFALTACNLYHVYFTTIPKTYSLGAFLILAGFLALTWCGENSVRSACCALLGGFLVSLAAGTRISLILILPVIAFLLLFQRRRAGGMSWFWFGIGGTIGIALVYGLPLLFAKEEFIWCQTFHLSRGGRNLMLMAGSLSRIVRGYAALVILSLAVLLWNASKGKGDGRETEDATLSCEKAFWRWGCLLAAGVVFAFQLCSPHPYDDYQVPVMGLFCVSSAAWLAEVDETRAKRSLVCLSAVATVLLVSFGSPLLQDWFVIRQDRFWTVMRKQSDLSLLRKTGREIAALSGAKGELLTQDAYLAVETGLSLPRGLEMGPFSYFPELNRDEAASNHVVNTEMLLSLLKSSSATVCAFSGYSWAIRSPVTDPVPDDERQVFLNAIRERYELVQTVHDFGQNQTTLQIYRRPHDDHSK